MRTKEKVKKLKNNTLIKSGTEKYLDVLKYVIKGSIENSRKDKIYK